MGNEQSQISGTQTRFGYRVLKRIKDETPLEPWFDFICGINGREIDDGDARLFQEEVHNCAGKSVSLGVWSAKGQTLRTIVIHLPLNDPAPLGVSLKWTGLAASEDVWHVLDISGGSPAEMAGLLPYSDYIIGTPLGVARGEGGLGELVEHHIDRPLQLYVYNHEFNVTREVTILPRKNWGGDGALGCVLGYGALHRLPRPLEEPLSEPGQVMFEYPTDEGATGEPGPVVTATHENPTFITPAFALNQVGSPPPPSQYQQVLSPTGVPTVGTPTSPPPSLAANRSPAPYPDAPPIMMDPAAIAALQSGRVTPSAPPQIPPSSSPYSQGSTAGPPPPRSGRVKAKPARGNRVNLMDAYMQEEENKSKKEDYVVDSVSASRSPPPPPGGGRAPPPRKGGS
ncbi:hypothetical protein DRE_03957 [Drechslerella stenobrocha 248]|uniref:PDZ GRASP-type domain-containing protein n=1 Tax=Drechslerella stenobrocha 248 TaxID=1043628 RepID=W7I2R5_9PEZI|nr:hypothetical protein DRE_03957 [Drechslerella stenobrocha 248]